MTDLHASALVPYTVIAVTALLVVCTLPGAAVLVLLGVAVATFAGARTIAPLLDATARRNAVAARWTAVVLVLLGGPVVAAATLGPRSVPLLACLVAVPALAWPAVIGQRGRGQVPRNVER